MIPTRSLPADVAPTVARERLRTLADCGEPLIVPGVQDALAARTAERAGFAAACVGGYAAAAAHFGLPDIGLVTQTEMAEHVRRIAGACSLCLIVDADTGYGDVINVVRTVREYERAGAAAIFMEDQVFPKRCGHMDGKSLVPKQVMAEKVRAAAEARMDPATILIARTDALSVTGVDDAVDRCNAYRDAGADWLFPDAPESLEQMHAIADRVRGPLVADMTEGSRTPLVDARTLADLGWRVVLFPSTVLRAAALAVQRALDTLARELTTEGIAEQLMDPEVLHELLGLAEWRAVESGATLRGPVHPE